MNPTAQTTARTAWRAALQLLARRGHSRGELAAKLARRGIGQPDIDAVLDRCMQLGYLNDADWAHAQVRQLGTKGHGVHYIRHVLQGKGIDAALIEAALVAAGDHWEAEAATSALSKKQPALAREKDLAKRRAKAYRFLVQRGFSAEATLRALNLKQGMKPSEG